MNTNKTAKPYTITTYTIILLAALIVSVVFSYRYSKISENFTEFTVTPDMYENYNGNRLDSLELSDGVLTAENDVNFIVIDDRQIIGSPLKSITLNVSELSCPPFETQLYILDSYQRFNFTLSEGECTIILPDSAELNNGVIPELIRIDLLNQAGEQVKIDNIIFNNPEALSKAGINVLWKKILVFFCLLAFIAVFCLYAVYRGSKKDKPNNLVAVSAAISALLCVAVRMYITKSYFVYIVFAFSVIYLLISIYFLINKIIVNAKLKPLTCTAINAIFSIVMLLLLYSVDIRLFLLFIPYPAYCIGYYNQRSEKSILEKYRQVLSNTKHKVSVLFQNNFVCAVLILIAMVTTILYCYNSNSSYKYYKEYTVTPDKYENYSGNRITGLEHSNGFMTATAMENFMVISDRAILDNPIKTITLNISELSEPSIETKLYILDDYQKIEFTLTKGENIITLPDKAYMNNGALPSCIRIDLLNAEGEQIRVDSVVFNEANACHKALLASVENNIAKFCCPFAFFIACLYIMKLGLTRQIPDKTVSIGSAAAIVLCAIIKIFIADGFILNVIIGFATMHVLAAVYFFITAYIVNNIKLKLLDRTSLAAICLFIFAAFLHYSSLWLSLIFALYLMYAIGYYRGDKEASQKYKNIMYAVSGIGFIILFAVSVIFIEHLTILYRAHETTFYSSLTKAFVLTEMLLALISAAALGCAENKALANSKAGYVFSLILPVLSAYAFTAAFDINLSTTAVIIGITLAISAGLALEYLKPCTCKVYKLESYEKDSFEKSILKTVLAVVYLAFWLLLFEAMIRYMLFDMGMFATLKHTIRFVFTHQFLYNLLFVGTFYAFLIWVAGAGIGTLILSIFNIFLFIGNFVKLRYHNTTFKPGDLLQISDFLRIVKVSIRPYHIAIIIIIIIMLTLILYLLRKYFKPKFRFAPVIIAIVGIYFACSLLYNSQLQDIEIRYADKWLDDKIRTERQGFYLYTYFNTLTIKDMIPVKPEGYSDEAMIKLKNEFDSIPAGNIDNTKPDVIMLMLESTFDIEAVPGLNFSEEAEENIKKYRTASIISPSYGGSTANVEFEALTGFSIAFMADNLVPYVTYWNGSDSYIPSIAHEFNNNGYHTIAIHPNNADFYNRSNIYTAMGFDDFISIEDMENPISRSIRSYVLNSELYELVMKKLSENSQQPQFMFVLNIENHNPYDIKDPHATLEITGNISEPDKFEAEIYTNTLKNDDKLIGEMIEYVNNTTRPTLLYIWGDHLPGLGVLVNSGYLNDPVQKYSTPLIIYSNYKDIELNEELLTPNQLATQALHDAGVKHSSYFNFIYSLRDKYPVIQKSFGVDNNSEEVQKYQTTQYDLLFGKRYLSDIAP